MVSQREEPPSMNLVKASWRVEKGRSKSGGLKTGDKRQKNKQETSVKETSVCLLDKRVKVKCKHTTVSTSARRPLLERDAKRKRCQEPPVVKGSPLAVCACDPP